MFVKKATLIDKHVTFNLLVTKFEAHLKIPCYLMKNRILRIVLNDKMIEP